MIARPGRRGIHRDFHESFIDSAKRTVKKANHQPGGILNQLAAMNARMPQHEPVMSSVYDVSGENRRNSLAVRCATSAKMNTTAAKHRTNGAYPASDVRNGSCGEPV